MNSTALGQLCVERRLLTEQQLERCLEIQRSSPQWRRLGEILLTEGMITARALANLLSIQDGMRDQLPAPAAAEADVPTSELAWLLKEARAHGAENLILGPGQPPAFWTRGSLELLEGPPLKLAQLQTMLAEALPADALRKVETDGSVVASVDLGGSGSVQVTLYRHAGGVGLSVQTLEERTHADLEDLGLPPRAKELARPGAGLVLVTGPARSGKSTVMCAMLGAISQAWACHMLVIDARRKMIFDPGRAFVSRRVVGEDTPSIASALEAALGAEPDVVAATALRDQASIEAALDLARAGRLVVAGMPTAGAAATVQRVLDACGLHARGVLASCLRGVLSLRLFSARRGAPVAVATELMLNSAGMISLVREGKVDQIPERLRESSAEGMVSLEESLAKLYMRGRISTRQAMESANDVDALRPMIGIDEEVVHVAR